jgi:hypothetical protein
MRIGEHSPSMGTRVRDGLRWLGLELGEAANTVSGPMCPGRDQAPSHDGLMTIDGQSRATPAQPAGEQAAGQPDPLTLRGRSRSG